MRQFVSILFFLTLFVLNSAAQLTISTDKRTDGVWSDDTQSWQVLAEDEEMLTFFVFNAEMSMFKHITPTITSAYIIHSQSYDETLDQYTFDVTSDVGNKYTMVIDLKANQIRFVYEEGGMLFLVQHRIKKAWTEDEEE